MNNTTPVVSPLLALLRSRKVIFSAIVMVIGVLVTQFPVLVPFRDTLISLLGIISLVVISGISVEDAAKYFAERGNPLPVSTNPVLSTEEQLRELINVAIDEYTRNMNPVQPAAPAAVVVNVPSVVSTDESRN